MAMQGNLRDMAVADLVQHNCQDRKTAQLMIDHHHDQAVLYFTDGKVAHATLGNMQGEEVIYRILGWEEGNFTLENGIEPPAVSIQRSWSSLLLEGARRLDETKTESAFPITHAIRTEVNPMAQKLEETLQSLGNEVNGYIASAVVGMDGMGIAQDVHAGKADVEAINAQAALLIKLVDTSTIKMNAGKLEDSLLTTENAYVLVRYLEGKGYFFVVLADRRAASLGNLRLMSRIYTERVSKAIPR
jgi:predicted regulator of Ras-like GTPase activity (Roadblock/LC7/MglB family)